MEDGNSPKIDSHTVQDKQKSLNEKHNNEKLAITLLIVGAGLIAYYFW